MIEAKDNFRNKDPDFVINYPGVDTKTVAIREDQLGELEWEYWNGGPKGFWALDLGDDGKFIEKYFSKGGHRYLAWMGFPEGFE